MYKGAESVGGTEIRLFGRARGRPHLKAEASAALASAADRLDHTLDEDATHRFLYLTGAWTPL